MNLNVSRKSPAGELMAADTLVSVDVVTTLGNI